MAPTSPALHGATLWLTGTHGEGALAVARALTAALAARRARVELLAGEALRAGLGPELGATPGDRAEGLRRAGLVARVLARNGVLAVLSAPWAQEPSETEELMLRVEAPSVGAPAATLGLGGALTAAEAVDAVLRFLQGLGLVPQRRERERLLARCAAPRPAAVGPRRATSPSWSPFLAGLAPRAPTLPFPCAEVPVGEEEPVRQAMADLTLWRVPCRLPPVCSSRGSAIRGTSTSSSTSSGASSGESSPARRSGSSA